MAVRAVSDPLGGVPKDSVKRRWCSVCVSIGGDLLTLLQVTYTCRPSAGPFIDCVGVHHRHRRRAADAVRGNLADRDFEYIWQSGAYLAGFVVAVALTIVTELKVDKPMVPIRVLRNRTTLLMILASVGVGVAMYGSGASSCRSTSSSAGGHRPLSSRC